MMLVLCTEEQNDSGFRMANKVFSYVMYFCLFLYSRQCQKLHLQCLVNILIKGDFQKCFSVHRETFPHVSTSRSGAKNTFKLLEELVWVRNESTSQSQQVYLRNVTTQHSLRQVCDYLDLLNTNPNLLLHSFSKLKKQTSAIKHYGNNRGNYVNFIFG